MRLHVVNVIIAGKKIMMKLYHVRHRSEQAANEHKKRIEKRKGECEDVFYQSGQWHLYYKFPKKIKKT